MLALCRQPRLCKNRGAWRRLTRERHAALYISSSNLAPLCKVPVPARFLFRFDQQLLFMNLFFIVILSTLIGCNGVPGPSNSYKDSVLVFAGTTPCGNVIRPIHNISPEPDCQLNTCKCFVVEWELTLYIDANTKQPTHYYLKGVNRYSVKETNMYSEPGTKSEAKGKWTIIKGTKTNSNAVLYQLNPDKPGMKLSFLKLSDNLLHIVDQDEKLMIGNEFHSYTLSRVSK